MIIIYMATSIIGGTATAALVRQHGLLLGLLAVPLGSSLSAPHRSLGGGLSSRNPLDVVGC